MKSNLTFFSILAISTILSNIYVFGQEPIDSLINVVKTSKEDTSKVNALNLLSSEAGWMVSNYDTAYYFANEAMHLAEDLRYEKGIAIAYNNLGIVNLYTGKGKDALKNFLAAWHIYEKIGDQERMAGTSGNLSVIYNRLGELDSAMKYSQIKLEFFKENGDKKVLADSYHHMGAIYTSLARYPEAMEYHLKSLEIKQEIGNKKGEAGSYNDIGNLLLYQGNFSEALEKFYAALRLRQEINDKQGIADSYNSIGNAYEGQGNQSEALENFYASLAIKQEIGNTGGSANVLNNIGKVYFNSGDFSKALENYLSALKIYEEMGDIRQVPLVYGNIGVVYGEQGDHKAALQNHLTSLKAFEEIGDKNGIVMCAINAGHSNAALSNFGEAKTYFEQSLALSKEIGAKERIMLSYGSMAMVDSAQGNYKNALENFKLYVLYKDSLNNDETRKQAMEARLNHAFEIKEATIRTEREINDLMDARTQDRKNTQRNFLFGGFGVMMLLAMGFLVQRNRVSKELRKVERMKNEFFSNVTHEFRTPITLIINPVERLLSRSESPEVRTELARINRSANQLLRLINQLLDVGKLDNGMMRIQFTQGEVVMFVQNIVEVFETLAEKRQIELRFKCEESHREVLFDPMAVEKILYNLISNAIKYSREEGRVTVSLNFTRHDGQDGIRIEVADNGPGIEEAEQKWIFNRYYRSQQDHKNSDGGSGIGLALVHDITRLYGGEITLESMPGIGSTFKVSLPVPNIPTAPGAIINPIDNFPVPVSKEVSHAVNAESNEKPLILVVEDNDDLRNFIRVCLIDHFNVLEAQNGMEGFQIAIENVPDAVVTDLMMPVMDGLELIEKLKVDPGTSHIPVIMLTAKSNREDRELAISKGADAFLSKPFYEKELLALLHNLLQLRRNTWNAYRSHIVNLQREGQSKVNDDFIQKLRQYIEENISDQNMGVDELSKAVAMSRNQLHRKLKAVSGHSPGAFIRLVKLERARDLVENDLYNISEVAYQTGFNSHSYFSKCFADAYGMSPKDFQSQYR